jgi:hypothetical protein
LITGSNDKVSAADLTSQFPVFTYLDASLFKSIKALHPSNGEMISQTLLHFCACGDLFGFSDSSRVSVMKLTSETCSAASDLSSEVIFMLDLRPYRGILAIDVDASSGLIVLLTNDQKISVYHLRTTELLWQRRLAFSHIARTANGTVRFKHGFLAVGSDEGALYVY